MKTPSHCIRIRSSSSTFGRTWSVVVEGEALGVFAGERSRDRALEYAFRQAETLRERGEVRVLIEPLAA